MDDWGALVGSLAALALFAAVILPVLVVRGLRWLWGRLGRS